jgi:VCBS repeat-containing protein
MEGSFAGPAGTGVVGHFATLNTDLAAGLMRTDDFKLEARFDLVFPDEEIESYGIRLTDAGVAGGGDDIVELAVRRQPGGALVVVLRESDVAGSVPVTLAQTPLVTAPTDQRIVLRLEHAANTNDVTGSFDLVAGNTVTSSFSFGPTVGHIFGNEAWTRAQFLSFSPSQPQNGRYGTLELEADGDWTYSLRNGLSDVQSLAQGERVTDVFTVQLNGPGGSQTKTVAVDVLGTNDLPFGNVSFSGPPAPGTTGAYVIEDGVQQVARGFSFGSDIDHGLPLRWSVSANAPGQVTPYSSDYRFTLDEFTVTRDGVVTLSDGFDDGAPPPGAPNPEFSYIMTGFFGEADGRAILDGHRAGAIGGAAISDLMAANVAILDTNLGDASPGRGLKSHHDFTIEARFDLDPDALPEIGQAFGVSLSDRSFGELPLEQQGDDIVGLLVTRNAAGELVVVFEERDAVADSVTVIDSEALIDPVAGSQIVLRLAHDTADFGRVSASFEVTGPVTQSWSSADDPARADRIFGAETPGNPYDDEGWTRVQVWAFGPDTGGITAQGAFGSVTVAPSGDWTYTLDNNASGVQALGRGQIATDSFNLRVIDQHGASTSRPFNVNVIGTGDEEPPVPVNVQGGPAAETFVGSRANDYFAGGGGADLLIGLDGSDTFDFNNLNEGVDSISGFTPGVGGDVLDLSDVLDFVPANPPSPAAPFNFVRLGTFQTADGINTQVSVNPDGIGEDFVQIANLMGTGQVFLDQLIADGNLLLG